MTEDRGQKADDGGQPTDDRGQGFCLRSDRWILQAAGFVEEIDKSEGNDYLKYR